MFQHSFPSVSHPHQTSLIKFKFVLHFCADFLCSFLQETEEIPLCSAIYSPFIHFFKKTCKPLPTEGQIHLFCLVREGYNQAFPGQGRAWVLQSCHFLSTPDWCSSNEFGTYSSWVYSAGLAQRDK